MATYHREIYRIADFTRWHERQELILQPKFQRRAAWEEKARSYLIDTVVRQLPLPKVYLRRIVSPETQLTAYEVVDGQQRLRAILDFRANNLVLSQKHHAELGDRRFDDLPRPVQSAFMTYQISTEVMEGASDEEVWGMFERLNTYTLTLNRQEKLNAEFFGYFKRTAYELAAQESALRAWRDLGIFGPRQIARMKEVELTSDVLVAIVRGISDIVAIRAAYKDFDDDFPQRIQASSLFERALQHQVKHYSQTIRATRFRQKVWFYSLLVATADILQGIPGGFGKNGLRPDRVVEARMQQLSMALQPTELPRGLSTLGNALRRATSHVPERLIRHEHFYELLTLSEEEWRRRWARLTAQRR